MLPDIANKIFHDLFRHIHVALQIAKRHLRLDHPKLVGMPRGVGILRPERRSEGVNL